MAYIVKVKIPDSIAKILSPKNRPLFKTQPEVVLDNIFQERLRVIMAHWLEVKALGV